MRKSFKKVAAGLLATMMIGTMLTGCGGGSKKTVVLQKRKLQRSTSDFHRLELRVIGV